jgi:predicted dehydrogenase
MDVREQARAEARQCLQIPVYDTFDEALESGTRFAIICTPTNRHLEYALRAAAAGCHLFIEKPLSHSPTGIEQLLEIAENKRLSTLVGCNFRFHPALQHVKKLLSEGLFEGPIFLRAHFGQYLPDWRPAQDYRESYSAHSETGGGVLLDRIHELDYVRWLAGEVTEVQAMLGRLSRLEIDAEDTADILLRFRGGSIGAIHLDYIRRTYDCSLEVTAEGGTIRWVYQYHSVEWYVASEQRWHRLQWAPFDGNQMYLDEMRHFIRVLRQEERAALDLRDAKRVLEIAFAVKKAARRGSCVRL